MVRIHHPLPPFAPRLRRAARPYKLRRPGGPPGTAWLDTRVEYHFYPSRGTRGPRYERRFCRFDSCLGYQFFPAGGTRLVPSEGAVRRFDSASGNQQLR